MDFSDASALESAADFLKSTEEDPKAKTGIVGHGRYQFSFFLNLSGNSGKPRPKRRSEDRPYSAATGQN